MTEHVTRLDPESILEEARRRTGGLDDFGPGPFIEPLERFLDSLETEARLNDHGRIIARERALLHVVNRLNYVNDRKRFPAIREQQTTKPVFIIGMPHTGATVLHDILAQDPSSRTPTTWETMFPSPPPQTATFRTDPRIAACQATIAARDVEIPELEAMHPMSPELAQECVTLMGDAMCTPLFHCQFRVPSYQDWVDNEPDWSHVYDFHHQQLQHLQSGHALERWVLSTGAHLWGLDHLLTTYPDARIVFTHRDPLTSMTSYTSLTSLVRGLSSDHVDRQEVSDDWIPRLRRVLMHGIEVRAAKEYPEARFLDVFFSDFIRDPFATVEQIYVTFDLTMTLEAAAAMKWFIADNPPGEHGLHVDEPHELGLEPHRVRAQFKEYIEHFDLRPK